MEGRQISRYRVLEQVGSGGMSVVYRGVDTTLEREVAIKVLHPHLASKEESRRRFSLEAKAVARLHHPNILEIFDFSGDDAPESFIITEFIRGSTLRAFAEQHRFHPPEIAAMALHELAAALEHAHAIGVVHRDLKPENVMLRDDGVLKLMDFGIAKFLEREERMTMTGALVGSPAHMAPEIIEGQEAGREADVFSLGTILYWLCCGKLPFQGNNTTQTLKLILEAQYPDPRIEAPAVSDEIVGILARCLAREPQDRYANAAELREALAELLLGVGIERPGEELSAFFTDPDGYRERFSRRLIEGLLAEAERCVSRAGRNAPRALECLNRVLALDPTNARAKELLDGMKRRRKRARQLTSLAVGAGALLLLGAVGAGGYRLYESRQAEHRASPVAPPPAISPPRPPAVTTPKPGPAEPTPGEPVKVEPDKTPTTVAGGQKPAETPPKVETPSRPAHDKPPKLAVAHVADRPRVEPARVEPPPAERGKLDVIVKTQSGPAWGRILVDGKWVNGQKPIFNGMVPAGPHRVRVEPSCCIAVEREVTVNPGENNAPVILMVQPKPALLSVVANEPCELWVAGAFRGTCANSVKDPVTIQVPNEALRGQVSFKLARAGKPDVVRNETFEAGQLKTLRQEFEN